LGNQPLDHVPAALQRIGNLVRVEAGRLTLSTRSRSVCSRGSIELRPIRPAERSSAWYCRNLRGGSTRSIRAGTRRLLSRPAAASSCTHAESTDVRDHRTTTRSAVLCALSISLQKRSPAFSWRSHHTEWPESSSAFDLLRPAEILSRVAEEYARQLPSPATANLLKNRDRRKKSLARVNCVVSKHQNV